MLARIYERNSHLAKFQVVCDTVNTVVLIQITVSATGVSRLLDHACGTRCQSIYGSVTV